MAGLLGFLVTTVLLLGPSAGKYAQQPENGIFGFALSSGDTLMHLEGCSSSLFQPVFRQARSGGVSASPKMVAGQIISFCVPWDEEMGAGSWLWRWGVFLTDRPLFLLGRI